MSVNFGPFVFSAPPPECAACGDPVGGVAYQSPACPHLMHATCAARRVLEEHRPSCPTCATAYPEEDLRQQAWMAASLEEEAARQRARAADMEARDAEQAERRRVAAARATSEVARLRRALEQDAQKYFKAVPEELVTALRTQNSAAVNFILPHLPQTVKVVSDAFEDAFAVWAEVLKEAVSCMDARVVEALQCNTDFLDFQYLATDLLVERLPTIPVQVVVALAQFIPEKSLAWYDIAYQLSQDKAEQVLLGLVYAKKVSLLVAMYEVVAGTDGASEALQQAWITLTTRHPELRAAVFSAAAQVGALSVVVSTADPKYHEHVLVTALKSSVTERRDAVTNYLLTRAEFKTDQVAAVLNWCAGTALRNMMSNRTVEAILSTHQDAFKGEHAITEAAKLGDLHFFEKLLTAYVFHATPEWQTPLTLATYAYGAELVNYIMESTKPPVEDRVNVALRDAYEIPISKRVLAALSIPPEHMDRILVDCENEVVAQFALKNGATRRAMGVALIRSVVTRHLNKTMMLVKHADQAAVDRAFTFLLSEQGNWDDGPDESEVFLQLLLSRASSQAQVQALVRLTLEDDKNPDGRAMIARSLRRRPEQQTDGL